MTCSKQNPERKFFTAIIPGVARITNHKLSTNEKQTSKKTKNPVKQNKTKLKQTKNSPEKYQANKIKNRYRIISLYELISSVIFGILSIIRLITFLESYAFLN